MSFQPDLRFGSLTDAFTYILGQYALKPHEQVWVQTESGLAYPSELPCYLFRGECGDFQTTMDSARRLEVDSSRDDFPLSPLEVIKLGKLIFDLAVQLCERLEGLDRLGALALMQHYGLPTRVVDFTGCLNYAFAFATVGKPSIGRIAVMPRTSTRSVRIANWIAHPWAERAQRQGAFGVVMSDTLTDLKSLSVRTELNIKWYEFPILSSDQDFFRDVYLGLMESRSDPSAGFLRFLVTEYVEAFGKFSPAFTDWLLERIPIAPYCYKVEAFEGNDVVVYYRGADALPKFDEKAEVEYTRRYWSVAHNDNSIERVKHFEWPSPGSIIADPRTYHPEV